MRRWREVEMVEGGGDRCASAPPEGRRDADGEERAKRSGKGGEEEVRWSVL